MDPVSKKGIHQGHHSPIYLNNVHIVQPQNVLRMLPIIALRGKEAHLGKKWLLVHGNQVVPTQEPSSTIGLGRGGGGLLLKGTVA
jgi:hypothetical protein